MRAMIVSARSTWVAARGGCAGRSSRSTLSCTIASTTASKIARTVARPSRLVNTETVGGMARASASIIVGSVAAATHRTRPSTERSSARPAVSSLGTIEPRAAIRTPSRATRLSHTRLAPRPSVSRCPLTATSQPKPSSTAIDNASAVTSRPNGMPGWTSQPCAGPPHSSNRVANASFGSGVAPRAPAHTMIRPFAHDACRATGSGGSCSSTARTDRPSAGERTSPYRSTSAVARRPLIVSTKSPTT